MKRLKVVWTTLLLAAFLIQLWQSFVLEKFAQSPPIHLTASEVFSVREVWKSEVFFATREQAHFLDMLSYWSLGLAVSGGLIGALEFWIKRKRENPA
jgi:hypothetical protein